MLAGKLCRLITQFQPDVNSMSFSKLAIALFSMFAIAVSTAANAQPLDGIGLKQQWFSHSGVSAGGKLADWYLDIDENSGLKSDFGKDVAVNVNQYVLPKSTLYTQTDSGVVRAIDGETGKVRWSVNVGVPSTESLGVAGSGQYVAVLKGSIVYCLSSETGAILWSHRCESAPTAPPQVDDGQFFVPLLTGRVERFDVENKGFNTVSFISSGSGATTSRPAVSELSKTVSTTSRRSIVTSMHCQKTEVLCSGKIQPALKLRKHRL